MKGVVMFMRMAAISGIVLFTGAATYSFAADEKTMMQHHDMMQHSAVDTRTPLGLSPQRKQHQLANMRSHVRALQSIVGLMAEEKFAAASRVAHAQLGLTEEMQKMCMMFNNADFVKLGLAFHRSADALGDALQSGDMKKSLRALNRTIGYCVQCHATYRQ